KDIDKLLEETINKIEDKYISLIKKTKRYLDLGFEISQLIMNGAEQSQYEDLSNERWKLEAELQGITYELEATNEKKR
nr:hypothetical protein [Bacteroidales bacterium]